MQMSHSGWEIFWYCDENGISIFHVLASRYNKERIVSPEIYGLSRTPFHLQQIEARPDEWVFVVDDEWGVEALFLKGVLSTCSVGPWNHYNAGHLINRTVIVLLTQGEGKIERAAHIADTLRWPAKKVTLVELPTNSIEEYLESGGNREKLFRLVSRTPPFYQRSIEPSHHSCSIQAIIEQRQKQKEGRADC